MEGVTINVVRSIKGEKKKKERVGKGNEGIAGRQTVSFV